VSTIPHSRLAANEVMPPPDISRVATIPHSRLAANEVMPPPGISRGATVPPRWLADPLWLYTAAKLSSISTNEIGHFYFCRSKNKNGQEKVF